MKQIDIMRTSASRPDYLKESTETLQKYLKFNGTFRWLIHEDCLNDKLSFECMDYIKKCGVYDVIERHSPNIGQGQSLTWLMNRVKSKYVINFEDDFKPLKDIDVDMLCDLMDKCRDINQIAFHKRPIMSEKPNFKKIHIVREGIDLVTNPHWAFTPSIFRLSFIKSKWTNIDFEPHWGINRRLKGGKRLRDAEWVMNNTGTYFLGRWKNKKFLKSNGGTLSQKEYDKIDNGFYAYHLGQIGGSVRKGTYKR